MATILHTPRVSALLNRLFAAAALDPTAAPRLQPDFDWETATAQERADAFASVYMPISARGGNLLYALTRASRPQTVVEFGTSFGISTIFLAAAVADNGSGRVVSSELSPTKIAAARENLVEAQLADHVTILAGDARMTLSALPAPIGFVLLDGWKDLYLSVLRLLEPQLANGALVVADDINQSSLTEYLEFVRDPANRYVSVSFPVEDGMEISCWTGLESKGTLVKGNSRSDQN